MKANRQWYLRVAKAFHKPGLNVTFEGRSEVYKLLENSVCGGRQRQAHVEV